MRMRRWALVAALALGGCTDAPPRMPGTLEWELVRLPAPVSERIVAIGVAEGEQVSAGQTIAQLDDARLTAELQAARAEAERAQRRLEELQAGPRMQRLAAARARLQRAESLAVNARHEHARVAAIVEQGLLPRADLDRAVAAAGAAQADVAAAAAEREELRAGTRGEELAQAEAALAAARARARAVATQHSRLRLRAPRAGRIESLPFEVGAEPPAGATLATLLVGEAPYARIYVPQPLRAGLAPGTVLHVHLEGSGRVLPGRVRSIASEPSFTPYFALSGDDAARLVYLAEVALGADAAALPAGLPLWAELPAAHAAHE